MFIKRTSNDENNYNIIYDNKEGVTETDLTTSSFWRPLTTSLVSKSIVFQLNCLLNIIQKKCLILSLAR